MKPKPILAGALFGLAIIVGSLLLGVNAKAQTATSTDTTSTTTLPNTGSGYGQ